MTESMAMRNVFAVHTGPSEPTPLRSASTQKKLFVTLGSSKKCDFFQGKIRVGSNRKPTCAALCPWTQEVYVCVPDT